MVLDKLSDALKGTLAKVARAMFVDEKLIDELVKDMQRALLAADVNVQLVLKLTKTIKERVLQEKPPAGISQKEYTIKVVYDELAKFLGGEGAKIEIAKKPFKMMFVGLFGSGKCVHKDSKLVLSNGEILSAEGLYNRYKIKEEKIDDCNIIDVEGENIFVPSFNQKTAKIENKRVTNLWKLRGKELLNVFLDNSNDFNIKVTPEHPFFVLKNGKIEKIRADALTGDDFVAVPINYIINGEKQKLFSEIKELNLDIQHKIDTSQLNIREFAKELKFNRNYCQLTEDLKKGVTPIFILKDYDMDKLFIRLRNAEKFISFPNYLTGDLAEFLGYVIGDGHLGKNYVEISNEDQEVIDRVIFLAKELFNSDVYIKKDLRTKKMVYLVISSKTLVEILNKIFNIPIGKKGKYLRIPSQISKSPLEIITRFLRAYFDCDASPSEYREIELCSESHDLIKDTAYLLNRLGIISSIGKRYIENIPYWRLFIRARYAEVYANRIGFIIKHKKERAENYGLIGSLQGCGKQDMLPLGNTLTELRRSFGFSIGEIQEYVNSYGTYERMGLISRESLASVIALYLLKKKGNFALILEQIAQGNEGTLRDAFVNGLKAVLRREDFIKEENGQVLLTEKAGLYLRNVGTRQDLLESFKLLVRSDVCWCRVKKIENNGYEEFVYDLTVEDNHSFIADNIIVHNTTSIGKIAKYYMKRGFKVCAVGLDVYRPAAMDQLEQLCNVINIPAFIDKKEKNPLKIYRYFEKELNTFDIILVDTSGRDALSTDLIKEIKELNEQIKPDENFLVISADIGQAAQTQAKAFHDAGAITGVIVTKMDGTARAGGALSACAITGTPIKLIGIGEKVDDMETFNPKGFVSRLLGMGDLESLLEKAEGAISSDQAEDLGKKFLKGEFNFIDLYEQMSAMSKMGSLSRLVDLIPGFGNVKIPKEMLERQEGKLKKWKFILQSMTKKELEDPELLDGGRVERIAKGSGTSIQEVRELLKQYRQSKKMMKMMKGNNPERMMKKLQSRMGSGK